MVATLHEVCVGKGLVIALELDLWRQAHGFCVVGTQVVPVTGYQYEELIIK